ncbi:hypothetical protein [Pseudomonas mangiferae]|uniref:Uncharacterized protein n=1 Tax=Pseudomonas mangiferae TaxID=2593654 RepID=A0A553GYN3_9PSED|nr:hypothetical protein [Pseudomonas mangiferae]TRX74599.1 hypothetical protein FM069_11365 [Pseudomonas mangiferae]
MSRSVPFLHCLLVLLGWLALAPAQAAAPAPLERLQVHACRAVSSLLLFRGEGFQPGHASRVETDIAALDRALAEVPAASDDLRQKEQLLVAELRRGLAFGHREEDLPWRYPQELGKALRDTLGAARAPGEGPREELPVKVEYLAVQYLSRAYIGSFETAREHTDTYIGQDERQLVPAIDAELAQLQSRNDPMAARLQARWNYLKTALSDMNSQTTALVSASGRPFAPITVDRHARALSAQWLQDGSAELAAAPR